LAEKLSVVESWRGRRQNKDGIAKRLSGAPFVSMVQATHLSNGNDTTVLRSVYGSRHRGVLSWRRYRPDPVPPEPGDPVLVEALCKYLGEATFKWLCACAVYPELHWDLTLQLGSLVCMDQGLISETNLLRLARLPWFRSGFMSDDLRLPLIRALTQSDERVVSTLRPAETPRVDCAALQTLRALLHSSVLHRTQGDLVHTSVVSVSGNHNTESQKLQYAGRYPPRAGRPLSGPASKELRLSAEPC